MALYINDIIELDSMKRMTLVAGERGTNRAVCSVGIADYEFAQSFLTATNNDENAFERDSLVLSSLLFAENLPDKILPAVKYLYNAGVSGFAYKTVIYQELPQEVLDFANTHDFPIFKFGRDLMFEDVIFEVSETVYQDDRENLSLNNLEGMISHRLSSQEVHTIAKNISLLLKEYTMGAFVIPHSDAKLRKIHLNATMRNKAIVSRYLNGFFVIMTYSRPEKDKFEVILQQLLAENGIRRESVEIYRSGIHHPFDHLDRCISESFETYLAAKEINTYYDDYTDIGTFKFLIPLKDSKELISFSRGITDRLESHEELFQTAICYVSNLGSIQKTADVCYCHPNSIRYRLNRIRTLLGMENNTELDFYEQLSTAIRIYMLRQEN